MNIYKIEVKRDPDEKKRWRWRAVISITKILEYDAIVKISRYGGSCKEAVSKAVEEVRCIRRSGALRFYSQ